MTSLSVGRFNIIEGTPPVAPGKCVVCGTTQGPFIDFGFDLDFYGVVYFCMSSCVTELANKLEYYSPAQWAHLEDDRDNLAYRCEKLEAENERLKNALDALGLLGISSGSDVIVEINREETVSESVRESEPDYTQPAEREIGSVEQVDESGSSDVHDDDSLDEFLADSI